MQYLELEQKYIEVQKDLQKQTENSIKINGVSLVQTRVIDFETEMLQKSSENKTIQHLQEHNAVLVDKLEIHLRKNIEIADDYKRMMIDNQKEVESHEKKLKTMEEEKAIFLTQFNQLALWAQDAQVEIAKLENESKTYQAEIAMYKSNSSTSPNSSIQPFELLEKENLENNYNRCLQEIEGLKRYLEIAKATEKQLKTQLKTISDSVETTSKFDDIKIFKADLEDKIHQINELQGQLALKTDEIHDLKEQNMILEGILSNEKMEISHSNDQLMFLHQEIQSYKQQLERAEMMVHGQNQAIRRKSDNDKDISLMQLQLKSEKETIKMDRENHQIEINSYKVWFF